MPPSIWDVFNANQAFVDNGAGFELSGKGVFIGIFVLVLTRLIGFLTQCLPLGNVDSSIIPRLACLFQRLCHLAVNPHFKGQLLWRIMSISVFSIEYD